MDVGVPFRPAGRGGCKWREGPTRNLRYIETQHTDQPAKKRATLYCIHVFPLLNHRMWQQLIFKHVYIYIYICVCVCVRYCVQCYRAHYVIKVLILWSWQRRFLYLCLPHIYIRCLIGHYILFNVCCMLYCTRTWSRCTRCVHGLAMGPSLFTNVKAIGSWRRHN